MKTVRAARPWGFDSLRFHHVLPPPAKGDGEMKLWIDDTVLVELFARGEEQRYIEAFGAPGMATLDARLRDLETKLAGALAQKLPPQVLAEALGRPA